MKMRPFAALTAVTAIAVLASLSACSSARMTQEMQEQQRNMSSENDAWQSDVERWKSENTALRSEVSGRTVGSDSALAKHFMNLEEHEQKLAGFDQSFQTHRTKVAEESAAADKDRIAAHAGLLAEHSKLKIE